ncbi:oligosaccharyl transferase, archaeosortase A system-associated [Salinibaculum rarum]|uniref:oligosaccharyl transferase, archaeosortase A system-associated n=1 Tax=Salinibaculum rarum TaxID=3058903 RepID=UPI0026604F08|nr:oligosaccharyl transferase, archaeosortase A system-associated [Salinibaculum sp. KK48]
MSNWREQVKGESGTGAFTALLGQYYHYVVVAFLLVFAFWNRARNWGRYLVDGTILFRGNDAWYHYRSTQYTVNNFPETMPFEVWTQFPIGTAPSQFGTFFDQLMAAMALVIGLGSPSEELVRRVVLISPALFGTLVLIPAYFVGRRLGGRFAGVLAASIIAFAPDRLLSLSVAGFSDHQVAEALFMALAVLAVMVALSVTQKEKPVYELLLERDFDALRRPLGYSVLAGVAVAMYLWTWPPGVLLLGILGVFFLIHLSAQVVRGQSPEHTAFAGVISMVVAGLLQLPSIATLEISATARSALQPGLAFAVAFGCVFMSWLFRQWEARELSKIGYPGAVAGILLVGAGFMAVVLPDLFGYFVDQVLRVIGFQTSPTAQTVGEAQPLSDPYTLYSYYRLALFAAIGGVGLVLARQFTATDPSGERLLVAIWFVFIIAATFTQARFGYYLAVPVAALTAVAVGEVMRFIPRVEDISKVEPYQVMAVVSVILIVLAPMFFGAGASVSVQAMESSDRAQNPGAGIVGWSDGLDWMAENTPAQGQYANPDGEVMEYYGTNARTDDYDYPEGSYGVMSWWDYGHWITVEGENIPVANPFQQQATKAANFLTAQNESRSEQVLEDIDEDDAQTRYVMVDWKMVETETQVGGKYFAPIRFNPNTTRSDFYTRVASLESLQQNGLLQGTDVIRQKQAYYDSMAVRLYRYHGSSMEPQPWVLDWQGGEQRLRNGDTVVSPPSDGQPIKRFQSMQEAKAFVENDTDAQIGGFGPYPQERVPALEHYRLVHMSEFSGLQGGLSQVFTRDANTPGFLGSLGISPNATQQDVRNAAIDGLYPNTPSWVKTFERVPGATIEGDGAAPNSTIRLQVELDPANGETFDYSQQVTTDEDGSFTATVPYASTGYDDVGLEDGHTNTSVRATGPYQIASSPTFENGTVTQYTGTVNVSESAVVSEDGSPVEVTLEEQSQEIDFGGDDGSDGTDGDTTDGSTDGSTDDGETTDDTNTTSGGSAQQSLTTDTAPTTIRAD